MSSSGTPTAPQDPDRLREEIIQTRAALGDTAEALAAKTDVKGRTKRAAAAAVDDARQRIDAVAEQTRQAVSTVADRTGVVAEKAGTAADAVAETTGAAVTSVRDTVRRADLPARARRPLPWAVIAAAIAVAGVVIFVVRRRRA